MLLRRPLGVALAVLLGLAGAVALPWSATPAHAVLQTICWENGTGGHWPTYQPQTEYVVAVHVDVPGCTRKDPTSGFEALDVIPPGDLGEGTVICWRWTDIIAPMNGSVLPAGSGWAYRDGYLTNAGCASGATTIDADNARQVYCPTCPRASAVVNDASRGRSQWFGDGTTRNGIAPNALTDFFGDHLADQSATAPAGSGCLETLGNRKVRVESSSGNSRYACLTSVSPTLIQFYLNAAPGDLPTNKDNDGRIHLHDQANNELNLNATHGAAVPVRAIVPGLYSADRTSYGFPWGYVRHVRPNGVQYTTPLTNGRTVALGQPGEKTYLVLYASGIRYQNRNDAFYLRVGDRFYGLTGSTQNSFGPAPGMPGVDEVGILLDKSFTFTNQPMYLQSNSGNDAPDYGRLSNNLTTSIGVKLGDIPVPGDYDGDGKDDVAIYRAEDHHWWVLYSSGHNGNLPSGDVGNFGFDGAIPIPGDYDGDHKADYAVFRTDDYHFWINYSSGRPGGGDVYHFDFPGGVPVPGDYDGDGITDIALYTPDHHWHVRYSSGRPGGDVGNFGLDDAVPVPGDYDGDGKTDFAIYRPGTAHWLIAYSASTDKDAGQFGFDDSLLAPGDYDGDHRVDLALDRRNDAHFWINYSTGAAGGDVGQWGFP
jgi:uncharacterized protein (TIGR03437 family)